MAVASAFGFVELPAQRSTTKPRRSGLTSMLDQGIPLGAQSDLLELAGHLIDIAKLTTATARVYDEKHLRAKLEAYAAHGVVSQMGGQFAEYAFATKGIDGARRLFAEAGKCRGTVSVSVNRRLNG